MRIREAAPEEFAAWDAFVDRHPHGTVFHLTAWRRALERVFPYAPHCLVAESGGAIAGVLPLFLVKNFLVGRALISSPFAVYGGILAETGEARQALAEAAAGLARRLEVEHLELRNAFEDQCAGFARLDRYVTFTFPLEPLSADELLARIPKKTRNMVRKARRFPYQVRRTRSLDGFYELLAHNYRRLGTPVFPRVWFEALCENYGGAVDVREVLLDGRLAAASLNFLYKGEMHTFYAASRAEYLPKAPNNYLYFDHLLWAAEHGCRSFDFGRSKKGTGNYEFKKHWGAAPRELPYEVLLVRRREMPNFTPKNPKYELAAKAWSRLPLGLTKRLGPRLIGLFP